MAEGILLNYATEPRIFGALAPTAEADDSELRVALSNLRDVSATTTFRGRGFLATTGRRYFAWSGGITVP